jgi:hypothetical protein
MKIGLLLIANVMPVIALADDALPKRPDFNRYQAMLNRSFAVETMTAPTASFDFPKDIYVAAVACVGDDCVATLASASDKNFKEYVRVKRTDMRWSAPK